MLGRVSTRGPAMARPQEVRSRRTGLLRSAPVAMMRASPMAKAVSPQPDVLVLGEHPSAYLAAVLVQGAAKTRVMHATIPGEEVDDRLVIFNPAFFARHASLEPLRRKLEMTGLY